jgi:PmbA protein
VIRALDVAEAALRAAEGEEAEAVVLSERSGLARFAGAEVHQPTLIENVVVNLLVAREGRLGTAATNRVDADGLRDLAARAIDGAASAGADGDFAGFATPEEVRAVEGFDPETASLAPEDQARLASAAIAAANGYGVYGYFTSGVTELGIAASTGLAVEQAMTDASALVVAAGEAQSGYAERTGWAARTIDPSLVAAEAVEKAARTRGATALEPGRYRAVLAPYALGELLHYFAYDAFGGLGVIEERSYLTGRIGEPVFDSKVSIADDPFDPRGLPKAFDFEGTPKQRVELIEAGVPRGFVWDRPTAARSASGAASTGHAPQPQLRDYGPLAYSLSVAGGDVESANALAELVGDGIYVTRLHYLSVVHPREGVITGMTRDGTFRIRDGRIAEPLVNLRFTVAVPDVLGEVLGLTREPTLVNASDFYGERYPYGVLAPAIATARFTITGTGSGPGL